MGDKAKSHTDNDDNGPACARDELNESTYDGPYELFDGELLAHGVGTLTFSNGDVYKGELCEGCIHGKGTYTWYDGPTYVGEFKNGVQDGYGELTELSGETYKGQWVNDLREGQGVTVYADGSSYTGEYKNDLCNGEGVRVYSDGTVYKGGWVDGKRCGRGVQIMSSGEQYEGEFKGDLYHGEGRYRFLDGGVGIATFVNGEILSSSSSPGITSGHACVEVRPETHSSGGAGKHAADPADHRPPNLASGEGGKRGHSEDKAVDMDSRSTTAALLEAMRGAIASADLEAPVRLRLDTSSPNKGIDLDVEMVLSNLPEAVRNSRVPTASILPPAVEASGVTSDQHSGKAGAEGVASATGAKGFASPCTLSLESCTSLMSSSTASRGISVEDLMKYSPMNLLGRGSFGAAYEAVLPTGRTVCVKVIELASVKDQGALKALLNEIALMQRIHHPNVVDFYGCIKQDDKQTLNIFMEYVTGGSLVTYAKKFKVIPEPTIRRWVYQMIYACKYLHENNIIHRDIKGENILMTNDGVVKFADFGCSKALDFVRDSSTTGCSTMVGSPYWMAPEVIMCSKEGNGSYGTKADIWSVGCTVIEMVTGKSPWPECSSVWRAVYQIANSTGPPPLDDPRISDALRDFLLTLFIRDPERRPSAAQLLLHPYLEPVRRQGR